MQSTLTAIKDFVLQYNPYFSAGYSDVYMDETKGYIANDKVIFPNDNLGNYFYLRLPHDVGFDYTPASRVDDCSNTPNPTGDVTIVAIVKDANPDKLIQNLLNTISGYNATVRLKGAKYNSANVTLTELGRASKEVKEAALKRLKHTIVSITFTLSVPFTLRRITSNCIIDPCQC